MTTHAFHADYGVEFREPGTGPNDPDHVWAKFELHEASTALHDGVTKKVYSFDTDDDEIAKRLLAVNDYGIRIAPATHDAESESEGESEGDNTGQSSAQIEAPSGNADRDEWAAFLIAQGLSVSDEEGRNDLRDRWKAHASA